MVVLLHNMPQQKAMKNEKIESDDEHLRIYIGRCNRVRCSDYDIREDYKVSTSQLQ